MLRSFFVRGFIGLRHAQNPISMVTGLRHYRIAQNEWGQN